MQMAGWDRDRPTALDFGYHLVGPVALRWILGLHQYISYHDIRDTKVLYCARAGVRIKRLLDIYYRSRSLAEEAPGELFWISRISVCKGTFNLARESAASVIANEFKHVPLSELVRAILRNSSEVLEKIDLEHASLKAHGKVFPGWIQSNLPGASEIRSYFDSCNQAFHTYVKSMMDGRDHALLIDSGWQGTSQSLLTDAFPNIEWRGAYIGRMLQPNFSSRILHNVFGILFESNSYDPLLPETAIVVHRHLFETLLEPNAPSVEEVPRGPDEYGRIPAIAQNINETVDPKIDAIYLAVEKYISDHANSSLSEIMSLYQSAMRELARVLTTPTATEAMALFCKDRSADFGRELTAPVLIVDQSETETPDARINRALWKQGQIALEYRDPAIRLDLQRRSLGLADNTSYFDPQASLFASDTASDAELGNRASVGRDAPSVAIITRTKNRPLLLKRAGKSIVDQTYSNYRWVVVNDGGSADAVREVIEASAVDRRKVLLVNHNASQGMEAASNSGIASTDSKYILIHDDDDTLHPTFLEQTVAFLESPRGSRYGGVITGITYVSEEIKGNGVIEHERKPYHDWIRNVHFTEMARGNIFPPIAFLFRREVYDDVGGYNEALPVLGDWFFNLEFLLRVDIGVIAEPLAYYHHRDRGTPDGVGAYANSVIGGVSKHEEFASVVRNEFIRRYAHNHAAVSAIVSGYFQSETRHLIDGLRHRASEPVTLSHTGLPTEVRHDRRDIERRIDEYDKLWIITKYNEKAHYSLSIIKRALHLFKNVRALDAEASWQEISNACARLRFKPPAPGNFGTDAYLAENPDVKADCESGKMHSAYHHYIVFGRIEGRRRPVRQ